MNVEIDETGANNFAAGIDDPIHRLRLVRAHRFDGVTFDDHRSIRDDFMSGAGPADDNAAVDTNAHGDFLLLRFYMLSRCNSIATVIPRRNRGISSSYEAENKREPSLPSG